MTRSVRKSHRAEIDLSEVVEWIRQSSPASALRFVDAAEATIRRLAKSPGVGFRVQLTDAELVDLRCSPVRGFKRYLIFYRSSGSELEIVRVLHDARNLVELLRPNE